MAKFVKILTPAGHKSHSEKWRRLATILLLLGACIGSGGMYGCKACSDAVEQPEPPPPHPPPPAPQPPDTPDLGASLPAPCSAKDGVHRFSLDGSDIGLPAEPDAGFAAKVIQHYGGSVRAVAYAGTHLLWSEGSTLKGPTIEEDFKSVINDLVTYTDQGVTHLVVATHSGIHRIPLTLTDTAVTLGTDRTIVKNLGGVTQLRAIVGPIPVTPTEAIPSGVDVSLNAPPPGTAVTSIPAALFFTTHKGEAYRWEGNCLTQLYDAEQHLQDGQPLKAVAIAGNARHAVILTEEFQPPSTDRAQKLGKVLGQFRAFHPGLGREAVNGLVARFIHFGSQQSAIQTLYHVDLVNKTIDPFWKTIPGTDDGVINDVALTEKHLFLQGFFYSRQQIDASLAKEEDRWKALADLAMVVTGADASAVPTPVVATVKVGAGRFTIDDLAATPAFVPFPAQPGGTLAPLFGQLTTYGGRLYFRGPFGYFVSSQADGKTPEVKIFQGSHAGFPYDFAIDERGERIGTALGSHRETALLSDAAATTATGYGAPERLESVTERYVIFTQADGKHYAMVDRLAGGGDAATIMLMPVPIKQLVEEKPGQTVTYHGIRIISVDATDFLVTAFSQSVPDQPDTPAVEKAAYGMVTVYPFAAGVIPSDGETFVQMMNKAIGGTLLGLMPGLKGSLFNDVKDLSPSADVRILDMAVASGGVVLLLRAEEKNVRYYRIAAYELRTEGEQVVVDFAGKSQPLKVTPKSDLVPARFAPHVSAALSSKLVPHPLMPGSVMKVYNYDVDTTSVSPEGYLDCQLHASGSGMGEMLPIDPCAVVAAKDDGLLAADRLGDTSVALTGTTASVVKHVAGPKTTPEKKFPFAAPATAGAILATADRHVMMRWSALYDGRVSILEGVQPKSATLKEALYPAAILNFYESQTPAEWVATSEDNGIVILLPF